jgi:cysteine sulfinate desulfinase/cysteine desulfurase-like protein
MGLSPELARCSIRFSFSRENTAPEIDAVVVELNRTLDRISTVLSNDGPVVVRRS